MNALRLFVWDSPYKIPLGGSMCFAIAESEDAARALLAQSRSYFFGMPHETPDQKLGKPTRVLDLPCGEWHGWSE